ncbi:tail tip protein Tal [Bacillus phage BCASJ1c]|uniref:Host specificity protein n=1 Tax=Bacillus phage BCASJ1c TaxID=294382 RepID=Q5YA57_9CAUD|nr:tail tip protein Tal [Bacillus phage BCASJ1c]AAU85100.1 host specificity protein [Bacillus phage BCASJ1c]
MPELYIFSQNDEPLTIITEDTGLVSAPVRIEVNSVPDTPFSFTVEADAENAKYVKEENKVVYRDHEGDLRLVVIRELDDSDDEEGPLTTAICEPEFMELAETFVLDRRFSDRTAQFALDAALENTGWVGEVEVDLGLASTNFYRTRVVDAIIEIISTWGGEFKDVVEFDHENNIVSRKIKILQRLGKDHGQRFEIDHNIIEIGRTVLSYPVTAMYGWGASLEIEDDQGEHTGGYTRYIDFADVEWRKSNGDPVDKPLGQKWVGDPEAFEKYKRFRGGKWIHRFGEFSNQNYDEPEELLWATWQNLQENKRPAVNYRLSVDLFDDKVSLGDTAIAIDRYFSRPIEIQTRIIAMEYDLLDIDGTMIVEMGQFLDLEDNRLDEVINEVERIRNRPARVTEGSFPDRIPPVPANIRVEDGYNDIQLYWDYPDVIYIKHYEVYGSQVQGFVPDSQHLLGRPTTAAFHHRAAVDQKWYFRIRAVNHHGRASDYSPEVSGSTLRIITDDILFGEKVAEMVRRDMLIAEMIADDSITWDMVSETAKNRIQQDAKDYTDEEITLVENSLMNQIADKAGLDYVDGQLQLKADQANVDDQISTVMQELADKASLTYVDGQLVDKVNVGTVYTISEIDNKFDNVVSLTRYTTDMDGVVTELESHETRIYQTEQGLGSKVEQTTFNQLVDDVGTIGSELNQAKTSIEQNATAIQSKAEQSTVNSLSGEVSNLSSTVTQHAGLIQQKVDSTTYQTDQDGIVTRFESVESVQEQHAGLISSKVDATYVSGAIADIEVGGRNLASKDLVARWGSGTVSLNNYVYTITSGSSGTGIRVSSSVFEPHTDYIMSFKIRKISGTVTTLAGHSSLMSASKVYRNGELISENNWSSGTGVNEYPDTDDVYEYVIYFRTGSLSSSDNNLYIQPNRAHYGYGYTVEVWDLQVEKGNKATDWTPAPEDVQQQIDDANNIISNHTTLFEQTERAINLRATKTEVNAIEGRLSQAESTLSVQASEIEAKVDVDGIVTSLNLSREGVRIDGALIELNGQTLIRNGIIGTAAIADGAISRAKLGTAVVDTLQVADGAITNAKIASLNADKINTPSLSAISANMGTVRSGRLLSNNNNMDLNLNTGTLHMQNADFTLGGGASIVFADAGNKITYSILGPNNFFRTAGFGVGRVAGNDLPFSYVGTTPRGNLDTLDSSFSGLMTHTTYHINNNDASNSISGNRFALRNTAVGWDRGINFNWNDTSIRTISPGNFDYEIGTFRRIYGKQSLSFTNYFNERSGWLMETQYSGSGADIVFRGSFGADYNYQIGQNSTNNAIRNIYLRNQPVIVSDERAKEDISDNTTGLSFINSIKTKMFRLKQKPSEGVRNPLQFGFIAQDIVKALNFQEIDIDDHTIIGVGEDGLYNLKEMQLIAPTIKAVQEVDKKVIKLEDEVNWLKIENQLLRNEIKELKNKIA